MNRLTPTVGQNGRRVAAGTWWVRPGDCWTFQTSARVMSAGEHKRRWAANVHRAATGACAGRFRHAQCVLLLTTQSLTTQRPATCLQQAFAAPMLAAGTGQGILWQNTTLRALHRVRACRDNIAIQAGTEGTNKKQGLWSVHWRARGSQDTNQRALPAANTEEGCGQPVGSDDGPDERLRCSCAGKGASVPPACSSRSSPST